MASDRTVVVLHEGWGRTEDIASVARRFEACGFRVVAPDLFDGVSVGRSLRTVIRQLRTGRGPMFDVARHALEGLRPASASVVGLSLGAAIVLRIPTALPVVAAYGHVPREIAATGPVLGVFGQADLFLRRSGRRLERCPTADVRWFEGAGHSFLVDPSIGVPARILRVGPHPAADVAWPMIEAFVDRNTAPVRR